MKAEELFNWTISNPPLLSTKARKTMFHKGQQSLSQWELFDMFWRCVCSDDWKKKKRKGKNERKETRTEKLTEEYGDDDFFSVQNLSQRRRIGVSWSVCAEDMCARHHTETQRDERGR